MDAIEVVLDKGCQKFVIPGEHSLNEPEYPLNGFEKRKGQKPPLNIREKPSADGTWEKWISGAKNGKLNAGFIVRFLHDYIEETLRKR